MHQDYVLQHLPLFRSLVRTRQEDFPLKIRTIDKRTLKFIVECAFNILKGVIPLHGLILENARRNKHLYKQLTSKRKSLKDKHLLLERHPKFTKSILRTVLSI